MAKSSFPRRCYALALLVFFSVFYTSAANWLCFTAEEENAELWCTNANVLNVQYSLDEGVTWLDLPSDEHVMLGNVGDKVYLKGEYTEGLTFTSANQLHIDMSAKMAASGSVMSLLDGEGSSMEIPVASCFYGLFQDCASLTHAPELPATTLTKDCYGSMFKGCFGLLEAPQLPATQLESYCYEKMFEQCTSLTKMPELPALSLGNHCYFSMFKSCLSLTDVAPLPATALARGCYESMFEGCYGLSEAPALPATTLKDACYMSMFKYCISLERAPELPAKELVRNCYKEMFSECTSLNYIKVGVLSVENDVDATKDWVVNVKDGVFVYPCGATYIFYDASALPFFDVQFEDYVVIYQNPDSSVIYRMEVTCGDPVKYPGATPIYKPGTTFVGWDNPSAELELDGSSVYYITAQYEKSDVDYLCFTAKEDGSEVWYENIDNYPDLWWSNNGGDWARWEENVPVRLENAGDRIYVSGNNPNGFSFGEKNKTRFKMTGKIAASGSVMSLVDEKGKATEIPNNGCFYELFRNCTSLIQAPDLPATTLTDSCYYGMFGECVNMTVAPELPAMELKPYCYSTMFRQCKSLLVAPELPAMTLAPRCYSSMFSDCVSLAVAPNLPAIELAEGCYNTMFTACERLTKAPLLPATKLADECYYFMFERCTNMEVVPEISATELSSMCCIGMFMFCSKLNYIKVNVKTLDNEVEATGSWVAYVDGPGKFIFPCGSTYDKHGSSEVPDNFDIISSPIVIFQNPDNGELWRDTIDCKTVPVYKGEIPTMGDGYVFKGWDKEFTQLDEPDIYYYTAEYEEEVIPNIDKLLCFTALEEEATISYENAGRNNPDVQYSLDGGKTWKVLVERDRIDLKAGEKIYFRGNNPDGFSHDESATRFVMQGKIAASGNVMSLLDEKGDLLEIPCDNCFNGLFSSCTSLVQAPELPATKLTRWCYTDMFAGCQNLLVAPELPATTVYEGSYRGMFRTCSELIAMPKLPATTLGARCYNGMFTGCSKLREVSELPATKMENACYEMMFYGCMDLETPPALPATELADSCYSWMFVACSNLTRAPELPATTLKDGCYGHMFTACSNLAYTPDLHATTLANRCCEAMFLGCSSLKKAPALPATEMKDFCYYTMFAGCTSLEKAPELPATKMALGCYDAMFGNCISLPEAPDLPATEMAVWCYESMFAGCSSLVKAPALPAEKLDVECYESMFSACKSLIEAPELPATTLAQGCYKNMFSGCASLVEAPELPAEDFVSECYKGMFENCSSLNYIKVGVMSLDNRVMATENWVRGVNGEGLFIFPCGSKYDRRGPFYVPYNFAIKSSPIIVFQNPDSTVLQRDTINCFETPEYRGETPTYGDGYVFVGWDKELSEISDPDVYYYTAVYEETDPAPGKWLCFTAEEAGSAVWYVNVNNNPDVQYSLDDGVTWHPLGDQEKVTLENVGDKVYVKGINPDGFSHTIGLSIGGVTDHLNYTRFAMSGRIAASGSVMSLIDGEGETDVIPCDYCFTSLFIGCNALTKAPELPAMTLTTHCYSSMFRSCLNLTKVPVLPATQLVQQCYACLFMDCHSLTDAPELPVMNLADRCYQGMFKNCKIMTEAPALPATKLERLCYMSMFEGCTSLIQAPDLLAEELVEQCYYQMFKDCSSLNYIRVGVTTLDNDFKATEEWVSGVDGEGVFIFPCGSKYDKHGISEVPDHFKIISSPIIVFQNPDSTVLWRDTINCGDTPVYKGEMPTYGDGLLFMGWDKELVPALVPDEYYYTAQYDDPSQCNWLCFTAEEAGATFNYRVANNFFPDVQYSVDGGRTWKKLDPVTSVVMENVGDKVYIRGNNPKGFSESIDRYAYFEMTSGAIAASGSVMSLIDGKGLSTTIPNDFCFAFLFSGCETLTKAPELPATSLRELCYFAMFGWCYNLKEAPLLPATQLAENCYGSMFTDCSSLTQAPALPATQLVPSCYSFMFQNCTNLKEAPVLESKQLAERCYASMFTNCSSLEKAPLLLATSLVEGCYQEMFSGCTSLNYIEVGVLTLDNNFDATLDWVSEVDGEGLFVFPCGSKYDKHGTSEVPMNFTIKSSPFIIFQNPDSTVLWRDTIPCDVVAEYKGPTPTFGDNYEFIGWEPELMIHEEPGTYYYTAIYREKSVPVKGDWLCFTAEEAGSEVSFSYGNEKVKPDLQYSTDGGRTWKTMESGERIVLKNIGDKVYFRGDNPNGFNQIDVENEDDYSLNEFDITGRVEASGNIMSLIDGEGKTTVIPNAGCFYSLFLHCTGLTRAPKLPATTLQPKCYSAMFYGCTNLIQAPELPATTLADGCYSAMFVSCRSLDRAPELLAKELVPNCYNIMFNGCTNINYIKVGVMTLDNDFFATTEWVDGIEVPGVFIFPCGSKYDKHGYSEVPYDFKIISSPIIVFQNPDSTVLWRDTIPCDVVVDYKGETPTLEGYEFVGWDKEFSIHEVPGTYYYTAVYNPIVSRYTLIDSVLSACDSLVLEGRLFTESATWRDSIANEEGDSLIVIYHLQMSHSVARDSFLSACESFTHEGILFRENASWSDTLTAVSGCDSVINYHLTIHKGVEVDSTIVAEYEFFWKGKTYTVDTLLTDTLQGAFGCDSIMKYHVTINKQSHYTVLDSVLSACESFVFEGRFFTESATWRDSVANEAGDSLIVIYHLTIHKGVEADTTVVAEDEFFWKGQTYTADTLLTDTLQGAFGCDSIMKYHVIINKQSHYTLLDSVLSACDSLVLEGRLFTESVTWKDTVANEAAGDSSVIAYHVQISHSTARDSFLSACESFTHEGILYQENATWIDTLTTVSGCDSIINYYLTIHKEVVKDTTIQAENRFTWKGITYTEDAYWSDTLQTVTGCDSVVNYTLVVKKYGQLHLAVDDDLILVLPGGQIPLGYELTGGLGSKYEIRYGDKSICGGNVENDSTVPLVCPFEMEPGTYVGTMVMYDDREGRAEAEFVFNVMLPDSKENSYYVKVWNDVVICRNGDGLFESFQWYKDRQVLDDATLQYYNDLTLLDGEYMVYVNDKYGKSYFIEPIRFEKEKAAYALTATPALVDRGADITVTVSGVDSEQMENARIVVFKSDGRVWRIHETVQEENHMNLWTGEYLLVLTVNDGKVANCKVVVK